MWDSSICLKGRIISVVVCLYIALQNANCQLLGANNVYREYSEVQQRPSAVKPYGTDNVQNQGGGGGYHSLTDVNDNVNKKWRTPESSVHHGGSYSTAAVAAQTDVVGSAVNAGGPVVVSGGSVVLRPSSAGGFVVDGSGIGKFGEPETAGVQLLQPYDVAADEVLQFGPPPPQHLHSFRHPFFHVSGMLQRLLFGKRVFDPSLLDGYTPLCSRLTAIGRFLLDRVFEPLFATGFFMAASYLFRTSVLPRIAHYIHVYAMMKDHVDDGRFAGGRQISGYLDVLYAAVNDAVNDDRPCFQRIICEAGLQVASSPLALSARR
ncbi:hypothetical protein ACI65C_011106 [Semiaphis heraclei]